MATPKPDSGERKRAVPAEQRNRETFFSLVNQYLPTLYRFARHELAYFQAVGDLEPGALTPEDVVDTVVLRGYGDFVKDPDARKIRGRLIRLAAEYIELEARNRSAEHERAVPLEQHVPSTPPAEWVTMQGEEMRYFYEPDEYLKLEDVIADVDVPTPEQEIERREIWRCVNRTLAQMPPPWRRAVLLSQVERLNDEELAIALGEPPAQTRRILEQARNYLREQLIKAGCNPK